MSYTLLAIAGGIALFALSQLLLRNKRPVHYCVAVAFFSLGYTLFYFGAVQAGFIYRLPALINSDISITFVLAPAIYLFFISMIFEGKKPLKTTFIISSFREFSLSVSLLTTHYRSHRRWKSILPFPGVLNKPASFSSVSPRTSFFSST